MRITFNAPFTLTFTILAALVLTFALLTNSNQELLVLHGDFTTNVWQSYIGIFLYPLKHANVQHLAGNFGIILLLCPILERKFGWKKLLGMCAATTVVIAILHIIISDNNLIGASGLVFMFIVLSSLIDSKGKEIPLTFILVAVLFLGQEIIGVFRHDAISQMAHICGGAMGIGFRYLIRL